MTIDDYEVLVHLSEAENQRLRMSDLSKHMVHSRSRLTQRVDRLEKRGLVCREKVDIDARGTWAVLTKAGNKAIEKAAPSHVEHARRFFFDHVNSKDVSAMTRSLEKIAEELRP